MARRTNTMHPYVALFVGGIVCQTHAALSNLGFSTVKCDSANAGLFTISGERIVADGKCLAAPQHEDERSYKGKHGFAQLQNTRYAVGMSISVAIGIAALFRPVLIQLLMPRVRDVQKGGIKYFVVERLTRRQDFSTRVVFALMAQALVLTMFSVFWDGAVFTETLTHKCDFVAQNPGFQCFVYEVDWRYMAVPTAAAVIGTVPNGECDHVCFEEHELSASRTLELTGIVGGLFQVVGKLMQVLCTIGALSSKERITRRIGGMFMMMGASLACFTVFEYFHGSGKLSSLLAVFATLQVALIFAVAGFMCSPGWCSCRRTDSQRDHFHDDGQDDENGDRHGEDDENSDRHGEDDENGDRHGEDDENSDRHGDRTLRKWRRESLSKSKGTKMVI